MRETLDNDISVEEVSLAVVREGTNDPFLRWSVPDAGLLGCWRVGDSVAVARNRGHRIGLPAPWLLLLGAADELGPFAARVPDLLGASPGGVTVSAPVYARIPASSWGLHERGRWEYMAISAPPAVPPDVRVQEVDDDDAIHDVLDDGNSTAHARPGDAGIACWLGVYDDVGLACVGALTVTDNGGAHLRAITTAARARRQGLGWAVSAALTARGLRDVSPEVTLGVYTDNAAALALYHRLGFTRVHSFVSAAVQDVAATSSGLSGRATSQASRS